MISSLYASLLALLIVWLSLRVIMIRRTKKVRLGDGGEPELQTAIRAHGLLTGSLRYRVLGMQVTIYTIIGLASANLAYALLRVL
ncbi:MAG: MAPEG family protein [Gammaproteobacteria bacterium]